MAILVTGGAGFIGSNFIKYWLKKCDEHIINLDLLTYAGNLSNLASFKKDPRHIFIQGNINNYKIVSEILEEYKPRAILNFAAESHVDRSIENPQIFVETNVVGTLNLLICATKFWNKLNLSQKNKFRFLQISTDEVYGSLRNSDQSFTEGNKFFPNSPYSASKASADHLVGSYYKTYNLPTLITHSSNNYGPCQLPEKLIPLVIEKAIQNESIPIYGDGKNIRDWLYVEDNCDAIKKVLFMGNVGETYNIGGSNEKTNNEIVNLICEILDKKLPRNINNQIKSYKDLIIYVKDRKGHDNRYSVNTSKIFNQLGWESQMDLNKGIEKTIDWYLNKFLN